MYAAPTRIDCPPGDSFGRCRFRPLSVLARRPGCLSLTGMSSSTIFSTDAVFTQKGKRQRRRILSTDAVSTKKEKRRRWLWLLVCLTTLRRRAETAKKRYAEPVKVTPQLRRCLRLYQLLRKKRRIHAVADECPSQHQSLFGPRGLVSQLFAITPMFETRCNAGGCACEGRRIRRSPSKCTA